MAYRANRDISVMSTGRAWRRGQSIGDGEIPLPIRDNLLKEGCIEYQIKPPIAEAQPTRRPKRKINESEL